jgi:membrane protein implicated in regulation of membrane protease activity
MGELAHLFASHLLLGWLAIGAVFLIVELLTGSGWLLWPAGSAAVVGLATLGLTMTWAGQGALFAVLTVISTYVGRRYLLGRARPGGDVNDTQARLIGHAGRAVDAFVGGQGRVFVDGKEWSAEADGGAAIQAGSPVQVVALVTGARLRVKPA